MTHPKDIVEGNKIMSKILKIQREGHLCTMLVQLASGHKEKWTYAKEDTSVGSSIIMVNREEA